MENGRLRVKSLGSRAGRSEAEAEAETEGGHPPVSVLPGEIQQVVSSRREIGQ